MGGSLSCDGAVAPARVVRPSLPRSSSAASLFATNGGRDRGGGRLRGWRGGTAAPDAEPADAGPVEARRLGMLRAGHFLQPSLEEALFGGVVGQLQRPAVGGSRLGKASEPAEEVGPGGVKVPVAVQRPRAAEVLHPRQTPLEPERE